MKDQNEVRFFVYSVSINITLVQRPNSPEYFSTKRKKLKITDSHLCKLLYLSTN